MTTLRLTRQVEDYVAYRRGLGFELQTQRRWLLDFARYRKLDRVKWLHGKVEQIDPEARQVRVQRDLRPWTQAFDEIFAQQLQGRVDPVQDGVAALRSVFDREDLESV